MESGQFPNPSAAYDYRIVTQRLTRQHIASHMACSKEMVSRLLRDLQAGGYVEMRERRLVLVKALPLRW